MMQFVFLETGLYTLLHIFSMEKLRLRRGKSVCPTVTPLESSKKQTNKQENQQQKERKWQQCHHF